MSRREIRRGIRWCKANLSAACCRTARLPQALAPTGVDPPWGRCRQVCTSGRREPTSPCTIGFPFGKTFGKKPSVHLAPTLSFGKRKVYPWPQLSPSGKKKKLYTRPQLSPSGRKKSVHLAPTLLRERRGDLTVRGGLRAGSQRLM